MLPSAKQAGPRPSRRAAAVLALFGVLTLAAPMVSLSLLPAAPPDVAQDSEPAPVSTAAAVAPAGPSETKIEKLPDGFPLKTVPVHGNPTLVTRPVGLAEVTAAPLWLEGFLKLDPNRQASVHSQFSGDVMAIGKVHDKLAGGAEGEEREIHQGDRVAKGQLLAVVWSKELGEKKSDLADAIAAKYVSEKELRTLGSGGTQKQVDLDDAAVQKAVRTLRMWRVPEEEIDSVRQDVEKRREQEAKSSEFGENWGRFEVRAPMAGVVLEKNVVTGDFVDQKSALFKIADLSKIMVVARVFESYISELQALPPERRQWSIHLQRRADAAAIGRFETIGEIIDSNGETTITGTVDNENGMLRPGQTVTARIVDSQIHGWGLTIPSAAIINDTPGSVMVSVSVMTDPAKPAAGPAFDWVQANVLRRSGGTVIVTPVQYAAVGANGITAEPTNPALRVGARVVVWGAPEAKRQGANAAPPSPPAGLGLVAPAHVKPGQTFKGFGTVFDPDGDCQFKEENGRMTIVIPKTWHDLTHTKNYSKVNAPRSPPRGQRRFLAGGQSRSLRIAHRQSGFRRHCGLCEFRFIDLARRSKLHPLGSGGVRRPAVRLGGAISKWQTGRPARQRYRRPGHLAAQ